MRLFWALVAALIVGGAFVLLMGGDRRSAADPSAPGLDAAPIERTTPVATSESGPPDEAEAAAVALPERDFRGESGTQAVPIVVDHRSPLDVTRRIDARTLELDGRFRIVGNGSTADPYRISWELLTSAAPFVDPARDALAPPPWVRAIDGTCVEISAFYSSAVRVQAARHLLLTLNRWDGCCIGLPPTPFDAIDVTMREPVPMGGLHLVRFGTFRGRLVVEPLHAAGFLIGLYRLEDATFEPK